MGGPGGRSVPGILRGQGVGQDSRQRAGAAEHRHVAARVLHRGSPFRGRSTWVSCALPGQCRRLCSRAARLPSFVVFRGLKARAPGPSPKTTRQDSFEPPVQPPTRDSESPVRLVTSDSCRDNSSLQTRQAASMHHVRTLRSRGTSRRCACSGKSSLLHCIAGKPCLKYPISISYSQTVVQRWQRGGRLLGGAHPYFGTQSAGLVHSGHSAAALTCAKLFTAI